MPSCDVLVVGGGCHGLAAAWAAQRRGRSVQVVERFSFGHDRGSSHGTSRITRTAYGDADFAQLAAHAMQQDWPELAGDLNITALHPTPGLFFGPDSARLRRFIAATQQVCPQIECLTPREAGARFPWFEFSAAHTVMVDPTAALVAAGEVLARLRATLAARGAQLTGDTLVRAVRSSTAAVVVETDRGVLEAGAVILAAGAWLPNLAPWLALPITPLRQHVGYYDLHLAAAERAPGRFPVWCWMGEAHNQFFYGLPEFGRPGVKLAQHVTQGPGDALDDGDAAALRGHERDALARADAFARELFGPRLRGRVGHETCLYGVAPDERFKVATSPDDPRVVAVAACSGHGFKFAPLVGRVAVELLLDGKPPPAPLV